MSVRGTLARVCVWVFTVTMSCAAASQGAEWQPGVSYATGTVVSYQGPSYRCLQAHLSQVGWEPPSAPALWQHQTGTPAPTATPAPRATPSPTITPTTRPAPTATPAPGDMFEVRPIAAAASAVDGAHVAANVTDDSLATRWSASGSGQWVRLDLGSVRTVTHVRVAVYQGNARRNGFDLQVSTDDVSWSSVFSGQSSGTTTQEQTYDFADRPARYVRYLGRGGTLNGGGTTTWNSVTEISVFAAGTATPTATPTPTARPRLTPTPSPTPTPTPTPSGTASPPQGPPSGRVLVGYWETWDGGAVHPPVGHIALNSSHAGYNVINVAFPVLRADGTCVLEDGMAPGEDVPTAAEIAQAKASGRRVLLSIGGAAAGMDLTSRAVADRFVSSAIQVLARDGYDGIDIDIETGLVAGPSWSQLSASQTNLIYIINRITDHFGPRFMLTMAPETAYVTGGTIAYGGPWGAYLPIINATRSKLTWIQMQYYNGHMYGKDGTAYPAGTVEGMVRQTEAMIDGFNVAGGAFFPGLPASKVVIGLPAAPGAGGGYMSPASVRSGWNTLAGRYPGLRGLMTWSINWDASKGYEFANNHRP